MAPPTETFPAIELPYRVQVTTQGKRRKGDAIDLKECELLEMVQYSCRVEDEQNGKPVRCYPIVRLFRKYAPMPSVYRRNDGKINSMDRCRHNIMVETTAWEGEGKGVND